MTCMTPLNHQSSYARDTEAKSNSPISLTRKLRATGLSLKCGKWPSWDFNPGGQALCPLVWPLCQRRIRAREVAERPDSDKERPCRPGRWISFFFFFLFLQKQQWLLHQKVTHETRPMSQTASCRVPRSWEHGAIVPAGRPHTPFIPSLCCSPPSETYCLKIQQQRLLPQSCCPVPPAVPGSSVSSQLRSSQSVCPHTSVAASPQQELSTWGPETPWISIT